MHHHDFYKRGEGTLVPLAMIVRNPLHISITLEVCRVLVSLDVSSPFTLYNSGGE